MTCPICRRAVKKTDPEFPFCSERCRSVDLGNWAMEKYVISTPASARDLLDSESSGSDDED